MRAKVLRGSVRRPRTTFARTDIRPLYFLISDDIVEEHHNLEFLAPLVADMVQNDPSKRPTMTEVVDRFSEIRSNLSWIELRSRLVRKDEVGAMKVFNDIYHLLWTVCQIILLRPAIPNTY